MQGKIVMYSNKLDRYKKPRDVGVHVCVYAHGQGKHNNQQCNYSLYDPSLPTFLHPPIITTVFSTPSCVHTCPKVVSPPAQGTAGGSAPHQQPATAYAHHLYCGHEFVDRILIPHQ